MWLLTGLCLFSACLEGSFAISEQFKTPWDWIGAERVNFGSWFKNGLQKGRQQEALWKAYKVKYRRQFTNWSSESRHKDAWRENDKLIQEHNRMANNGIYSYYTAENQFSDMSEAELDHMLLNNAKSESEETGPPITTLKTEFTSTKTTTIAPSTTESIIMYTTELTVTNRSSNYSFLRPEVTGLPSIVDWREEGLVTRVRNQLRCNSCSAFAALGALEAQWAKKTGSLINLSAQQIVDCGGKDAGGCVEGAWADDVFKYVMDSGGVSSEVCYPYAGQMQNCNYMPSCEAANLTSWSHVEPGNETALKEVIANVGPVAVAVAIEKTFPFYSSGIYNNPNCSTEKKHALLIIGYGSEDGMDYWLVKNSWGKSWGIRGYGKLIRNNNNQCLISTYAYYPSV